jgi:hypothetical protein
MQREVKGMRILYERREALEQAISHVDERSGGDQESFTGAPDMSHEPRPEEREG